jgi:phosphate transport system substrate-binding protein
MITRRARLAVGLAAAVAAVALASCKQQSKQLLLGGSSAMNAYMRVLVGDPKATDADKKLGAYGRTHPDVIVYNEAGGSHAGIIALKRNAIDIAMATRDLTPKQEDDNLRNYMIARDAIAMVVNDKNPVKQVTKVQLAAIYEGKITSWKELGGNDAPIDLVTRDANNPTQGSARDLIVNGDEIPAGRVAATKEEQTKLIVDDVNALTFVPLGRANLPGIRPLIIDDVPMTRATILSGRYPLTRSFYLITYGPESPLVAEFVDFARSTEGQKALESAHLIALY